MPLFSLTLGLALLGSSGLGDQGFQLQQPQQTTEVSVGEMLTLHCTVTERGVQGPVKWFKGSGSGRQLIYPEKELFSRVARAVPDSLSDYSIHISDICPEDAGTYYCVKFKKDTDDKEYRSGAGTVVSVGRLPRAATAAVGGAACVLVLLLLVAIHVSLRKRRGPSCHGPRSPAPPSAPSSCPHQVGGPPPAGFKLGSLGEGEDEAGGNIRLPDQTAPTTTAQPRPTSEAIKQPNDGKDKNILYTEVLHVGGAQPPKKSPMEEQTEYAAIKAAPAASR